MQTSFTVNYQHFQFSTFLLMLWSMSFFCLFKEIKSIGYIYNSEATRTIKGKLHIIKHHCHVLDHGCILYKDISCIFHETLEIGSYNGKYLNLT